jgi:ABC-2 type transport system ATP-binding protein
MILELDSIWKRYGSREVLRGLSLQLEAGEVYGLIGPNGAGKTSAINVLCGLVEPDRGSALVLGEPLTRPGRKRIGVVPQEISVYQHLTCRENLRFFASLFGLDGRLGRRRIAEVLEQMQLDEYADTVASTLSGGWQRRLNIAASIIHAPCALVLDEPTAGLDVEARHELWELLLQLQRADVAVLLTTHQLDEAERLCTRVGILHDGTILAEGSLDELRSSIPAVSLAEVLTDDEPGLEQRASSLGWQVRRKGGRQTLWLPRPMSLSALVSHLDGCELTSVTLREIGLEDVYLEVTAASASRP